QKLIRDLVVIFVLTFAVAVIVSYLYSLVVHGVGAPDWGTAVRLGIILSIILTWMDRRKTAG
ncbi:MAG: hypothetical protein GY953_11170, partial [bacterium]|nr:hypothetical protein [bacterium]